MEIFVALFMGYIFYVLFFLYCLIPMVIQIAVSFVIVQKQVWKVAIMVFSTQGVIIPIARMISDMICYTAMDFSLKNVIHFLTMFAFLIVIGFFIYRSNEHKMNLKKWVALLAGYFINVTIMVFMMIRFGIIDFL